jgi:hypothetical protein
MTRQQLIELVKFTAGEMGTPATLNDEDAASILDDFVDTEQSEQLVCECGNKLTDKELYFGQCLQCDKSVEEVK